MPRHTDTKPVLFQHSLSHLLSRFFVHVRFVAFGLSVSVFLAVLLPLFFLTRASYAGVTRDTSASRVAPVAAPQASLATTAPATSPFVRAFTDVKHLIAQLAPQTATAAASDNLNFQARLQATSGAIVPDGYYNIQFKLYSASTGGSALWTETYAYNSGSGACTGPLGANDCRVRVANGYVSVYLGSQTAFPVNMPWDQQLYLTMNIGGVATTGSYPTMGDGEMSPRLKLTAVPYAMKANSANQLLTTNGSNTATLSIASPTTTGTQTFVIPDQGAAGTYNILTDHSGPLLLGTSFIQNQNTAQQATSNFWISGAGRADTSILTPTLDTATATALNIGAASPTTTRINLNQNTVVASGKTITLTGGTTASRPASPTEGMLYYDTDTKQLLTYANGKWQGDRTTTTKIVAASNSSQAEKDAADYVATATNAQTAINNALTAAAGGKVYLMEGTYTIGASISIPNNTTLAGAGAGTVVTVADNFNTGIDAITNTDTATGTGVVVQDLRAEGNKTHQSAGVMNGIRFSSVGSGTGSSAVQGGRIANVWVNNWNNNGILLYPSSNSIVTGTVTQGNTTAGIYLQSSSNNTITGNVAQGNGTAGIYVSSSSDNTFTGNTAQGNGGYGGMYLNASSVNTITGNALDGNTNYGVTVNGGANNAVVGNTLRHNTTGGVLINYSSNNVVSTNAIYDNGGATDNNGIFIGDSDGSSITGNLITDTSASLTNYAINVSNNTSHATYLNANTLGTGSINDAGTDTIYGGQVNAAGNYVIQPAGTIELMKNTNVNGSLSASTSVLTPSLDRASAGTLTIGTNATNTTAISIGSAGMTTSVAGKLAVGVTTSSANANIQVQGTLGIIGPVSYPVYFDNSPSSAYWTIDKSNTASDASVVFRDQGVVKAEIGLVTDNNIHFKTATGAAGSETYTDRLIIQATGETYTTGKLGVGTVPTEQLHVAASSSASKVLTKIENTNVGVGSSRSSGLQLASSTNNWTVGTDVGLNGSNNFAIQDNNFGYMPRFFIDSTGRVGIGTDSPSYKLDIAGDARTAGNLTVGSTAGSGTLTNNGSTKNVSLALGDLAAGSIGTAATTVDVYTSFTISPTAAGRTYTIPAPTDGAAGRTIYISNINATNTFIIGSTTFNTHSTATLVYDGTSWNFTLADSTGSGSYIQNQSAVTQSATFKISGAGTLGGLLTASAGVTTSLINSTAADLSLQTTTSGNINIAPAGTINLNSNTTVATGKNFTVTNGTTSITGTTNINTSGAAVTSIGTGTGNNSIGNTTGTLGLTGSTVTVLGATSINTNINSAVSINTGTNNTLVTIGGGAGTFSLQTSNIDISNAGSITGATGISMASGNFLQSGSGSFGTGSGTVSLNGAVSAASTIDVTGSFATKKGSDYTTVGTTNDVNFGDVSLVRLTGASTQTITGITGGRDGKQLTIINAAGQMAFLANSSASSLAANRITTGISDNLGLPVGGSISLVYDSGANLWRVIGTTPTAVPMVRAYTTTTQSVTSGYWNIMALNQESFDNNNMHDNVTNNSRLTAQTAGYYHVAGRVGFAPNATGTRYAGIFVNGTAGTGGTGTQYANSSTQTAATASNIIVNVVATLYLNVGDYVELEGWQNSGISINTAATAGDSGFEMYRIDGGMTNPVVGNSYIQNQTATPQSASFYISGTGQISSGSSVGLAIQSSSQAIRMLNGSRATFVDSANSNMWNIDNFTGGTFRIFKEDYNATGTGTNGIVALSMDGAGSITFNGSSSVQNVITIQVAGVSKGSWIAQSNGNNSISSVGTGTLGLNSTDGGAVVVGRGKDFLLAADSGTPLDSGDFIFTDNALAERARIWSDAANINVLHIRTSSSGNSINISNVASCSIGYGTASTSCSSDQRLKDNITATTDNLAKVMQLQPVSYTWKSQAANPKTRIGLIAQNVLQSFPEAVDVDANGYYTLDYSSLVSPLIGAVQEQQAQIDTLKTSITALQGTSLKNGGNINGSISISGNLSVAGTVTIAGELHTGDIYIGGHLASKGATPTLVVGSALGSGAGGVGNPAVAADGTDTAGTVTITAGMQGVLSGVLTHVGFSRNYTGNYKVVISASNDHAADLKLYTANKTATGFDIVSSATVVASQQYQIDYVIVDTSN